MAILEMNSVLFEDINERVQRYLLHPFLTRYDIVPSASRFHFDVASAIMHIGGVQEQEAKDVLTAVLLLQRGLSIHDDIDQQKGQRRQLYVLTGDFSSSQYYYVLAHLGNKTLLYGLCDAVMKINETKMALLDFREDAPVSDLVEAYARIEGELLYALMHQYLDHPQEWSLQIESLVQAFVFKKALSLQSMQNLPLRQVHEWFTDTIDRLLAVQNSAILAPISSFLIDYLRSRQREFEPYTTLSEGNS